MLIKIPSTFLFYLKKLTSEEEDIYVLLDITTLEIQIFSLCLYKDQRFFYLITNVI